MDVQRRIAALDAEYTIAQPKRPSRTIKRALVVIVLALIGITAISYAHRTTSDFVQLTLKHGPVPAMFGAASTGSKGGD